MSLSCSHQIPIGPPPSCSAQGLHCSSVCADFCSSSSCVPVMPGHSPCSKFDTGSALSLWTYLLIMKMCFTLVLLPHLAWPCLDDLHINVTTKCLRLQEADWGVSDNLTSLVPSLRKISLKIRSSKTLLFWSACAQAYSCTSEKYWLKSGVYLHILVFTHVGFYTAAKAWLAIANCFPKEWKYSDRR